MQNKCFFCGSKVKTPHFPINDKALCEKCAIKLVDFMAVDRKDGLEK